MSLTITGSYMSQPTRAVIWLCEYLRVPFNFHKINVPGGEHLSAEYTKRNPTAKFPVMEENGFYLWESNAIMRYIVCKYSPNSGLYPSDMKERAVVDQWLEWKHNFIRPGACGIVRRRVLSKIAKDISKHSMRFDLVEIPEEREVRILLDSLRMMEDQLATTQYLAGNTFTLADIAVAVEMEQLELLPSNQGPPFGSDLSSFPQVLRWMKQVRRIDGFDKVHQLVHDTAKRIKSPPSKL